MGRILVALIAAWTAFVAIPGALPWAATDDAARAIAIAAAVASIVAVIGLVIVFARPDDLGDDAATFGTAAAMIAVVLAALEVVNLMLIPEDAPYRETAIAIGLLILLAVALISVTAMRTGLFEGLRFSSTTVIGSLAAIALLGVYLFVVQSLFARTGPDVLEPEWTRINALLTGLQTLAVAAAGALLGSAVQGQVTSSVREELASTGAAAEELDDTVQELERKAEQGELVEVTQPNGAVAMVDEALGEDPNRYGTLLLRNEEARNRVQALVRPSDQLAANLRRSLDRSRRLRRGS